MRTEVRIVASAAALPEIHASGGLSARRTGPHTVHFIGTAATPLGGDELDITIVVGPGARLTVRSVAATIALPSAATPDSVGRWHFEIAEGAELDFDPEPTIVAGGARHHTVSSIALAPDARLRLRERVQIGRAGENGGGWRGDLIADLGELPLLRHRLALGAGSAADDALAAPRALESELRYPDDRPAATTGLAETRLPLAAGGTLLTRTSPVLVAR
ncbi:urease accessory protein [Nocardia tenerifensis]|uniref:Urease accessory protein n=1 Tax=Nocardia tenerifensis TaxID=228006 RepID=A0A318JYH6_9NOCA|nr:urease accessory protein UreD [Nocardia tenerifensis]PXX59138.1 urease accessory protein [Nocardia tenerifensis]